MWLSAFQFGISRCQRVPCNFCGDKIQIDMLGRIAWFVLPFVQPHHDPACFGIIAICFIPLVPRWELLEGRFLVRLISVWITPFYLLRRLSCHKHLSGHSIHRTGHVAKVKGSCH